MASTKGIRAGRAFVELFADDSKLVRGLRRASRKLKAFGGAVSGIGVKMAAMGSAIVLPLVAATKVFLTLGDQLQKMALRTGLAVEALSALSFAADRSGTSLEALEGGLRRMQRTVFDAGRGLAEAKDALKELGLGVKQIQRLRPEDQFRLLAEQLSKIEDPTKKAALAMIIFGRAGTALLPMFERGAAGLDEFTAAAERLGVIVSKEAADAAAELTDQLGDLMTVAKMAAFQIGAALAGDLKKMGKAITEAISDAVRWIKANKELVKTWTVGIAKAAAWTVGIGVALLVTGKLIGVIGGLTAAIAFLLVHPIVALFAGLTLAVMGTVFAIQRLTKHVADYSSKAAEAAEAGMKLRAEQFKQIGRLKKLAGETRLNNDQMIEAKGVIKTLTEHYGDLGIKLDETKGKLEGVATAHDKMLAAMRKVAVFEAEAQLIELQQNLAEAAQATLEPGVIKELGRAGLRLLRSVDDTKKAWNELDAAQQAEARAYQARLQMTLLGIAAIQTRLKALRTGDVGALVPKPAEAEKPIALPVPDALLGKPASWAELGARFSKFGAEALDVIDDIKLAWLDVFDPLTARLPKLPKLPDLGTAELEERLSIVGLFQGRIAGLGGGGAIERVAKAAEKQVDIVDDIRDTNKEIAANTATPLAFG